MRALTAVALNAAFAAHYPQAGVISSLSASAEAGEVKEISAAAIVQYQKPSDLVWVKAITPFTIGLGSHVLKGDFAQVNEQTANLLVSAERAELATDEEVAAAATKGKTEVKG